MLGDLSGHSGEKNSSLPKNLTLCYHQKEKHTKALETSYVRSSIHSYHNCARVSGYIIVILIQCCVRELNSVPVLKEAKIFFKKPSSI